MKHKKHYLLFVLVLLVSGCVSTSNTRESSEGPFSLTAEQADQVILRSIQQGWPDKEPERVGSDSIGYKFKVWFAIDHDVVTAEAIPVANSQYDFYVRNKGTAPAVGDPARHKLIDLLIENAKNLRGSN